MQIYIIKACPQCGKEGYEAKAGPDCFPVHTCREDLQRYCDECGEGNGKACPVCGSINYTDYHRVYTILKS